MPQSNFRAGDLVTIIDGCAAYSITLPGSRGRVVETDGHTANVDFYYLSDERRDFPPSWSDTSRFPVLSQYLRLLTEEELIEQDFANVYEKPEKAPRLTKQEEIIHHIRSLHRRQIFYKKLKHRLPTWRQECESVEDHTPKKLVGDAGLAQSLRVPTAYEYARAS